MSHTRTHTAGGTGSHSPMGCREWSSSLLRRRSLVVFEQRTHTQCLYLRPHSLWGPLACHWSITTRRGNWPTLLSHSEDVMMSVLLCTILVWGNIEWLWHCVQVLNYVDKSVKSIKHDQVLRLTPHHSVTWLHSQVFNILLTVCVCMCLCVCVCVWVCMCVCVCVRVCVYENFCVYCELRTIYCTAIVSYRSGIIWQLDKGKKEKAIWKTVNTSLIEVLEQAYQAKEIDIKEKNLVVRSIILFALMLWIYLLSRLTLKPWRCTVPSKASWGGPIMMDCLSSLLCQRKTTLYRQRLAMFR